MNHHLFKTTRTWVHLLVGNLLLAGCVNCLGADASDWQLLTAKSGQAKLSDFVSMVAESQPDNQTMYTSGGKPYTLPNALVRLGQGADVIHLKLRPDSDTKSVDGRGLLIVQWTCPSDGNREVLLKCGNVGTDVKGGDGGVVRALLARAGDDSAATVVWTPIGIPESANPKPSVEKRSVYAFKKGDRLLMTFDANADGYGDQWEVDLSLNLSQQKVESPAVTGAEGTVDEWSFLTVAGGDVKLAHYVPMKPENQSGKTITFTPKGSPYTYPSLLMTRDDRQMQLIIRPRSDKEAVDGRGLVIARWTCPESGNWAIKLHCENRGTDVKGGDGGLLTVSLVRPDDKYDITSAFDRRSIPSSAAANPVVELNDTFVLSAGDSLLFHFDAGLDGYGDSYDVRITPNKTEQPGKQIPSRNLESLISTPPDGPAWDVPAVRFKPGMMWLGGYANKDSVQYIRKFIPDLALIRDMIYPAKADEWYPAQGIPVLIQNWGAGYEPYLKAKDAFEVNWQGVVFDRTRENYPGSGCSHAAALPHPATRDAYGRLVQSSVRQGYTGFGYCDLVWFWGGGRGLSGHNPMTVEAFRQDLLGSDSGLDAALDGKAVRHFLFADYARYYIGGMLAPQDLGLANWRDYTPPSAGTFWKLPSADRTRQNLLFDLLCHYEWLKFAQFLGTTAEKEGGVAQVMPNPEDMANGTDFLFGAANPHIFSMDEEFFDVPTFLDGAYYHFPYLKKPSGNGREACALMESSSGGNSWPYYATELGYAISYDLAAATGSQHMEFDFWPNTPGMPLSKILENEQYRLRSQQIMAYGLGFCHAYQDKSQRVPSDFITVTSRRIFRPWGADWQRWSWELNVDGSAEPQLAQGGYIFDGIGEEGLDHIELPQKLIMYTPSPPTEQGLDRIMSLMRGGKVSHCIMFAPQLREMVSYRFTESPVADKLNELRVAVVEANLPISGPLVRADGKAVSGSNFTVDGKLYDMPGAQIEITIAGQPLVMSKKIGAATLHVLLFDPTARANNAALTQNVFSILLADMGITPHWISVNGSMARLYRSGDLRVAGVQSANVRDWNQRVDRGDGKGQYLPYQINAKTEIRVKATPKVTYDWVALPSGRRGSTAADSQGNLMLQFEGTSHEIFFFGEPARVTARLDEIQRRKDTLHEAVSFRQLTD